MATRWICRLPGVAKCARRRSESGYARAGSKKRPFFRIVVADSRAARDSSFVEILGHYNPRTKPALVDVNKDRVAYWMSKGAQPSDSVRTLIARHLTPIAVPAEAPKAL